MSTGTTLEILQKSLPKGCSKNLTQDMVNNINLLAQDPQLQQNYRDNLIGYASVMNDGRYKMQSYIDAVRYVSFKLFGDTNVLAYNKTFPDRYQGFIDREMDDKTISGFVSAYNKTQLVQKIFEQTLTPAHIYNADIYQKAINVQAELMVSADSEKVRTDAANSLLTQLKAPETKKIELDIGVKQDKSIDELRATTMELVKQQKQMIADGHTNAKTVAHSKLLIEGDVEIVEP